MDKTVEDIEQAMKLIRRVMNRRKERKLTRALLNLDNWLFEYKKKNGLDVDPELTELRRKVAELEIIQCSG